MHASIIGVIPATKTSIEMSVRERASARTEREEAVPVQGTSALNRAPTQENFTKNSFQFIKGAGE